MATNPKVTRLRSELDQAYTTIERQKSAISFYREKSKKLEARLARLNASKKNKKTKKHKGS
jgi:hypothetical protein